MRVRNKPWAAEKLSKSEQYVAVDPETWKGRWQERFGNSRPVHVEVGSGKGRFIVGMAKLNPEINYIGIERQSSVAVMALDKIIDSGLPNVQLLNSEGENVADFFEENEVERIYLNFSDPWPKTKHEKRRLTSPQFLKNYESILIPNGEIHLKTDNQGFFEYSLTSFSKYGMTLENVWLDLHNSTFEKNVQTEYEEKFAAKGQNIFRAEARFSAKK